MTIEAEVLHRDCSQVSKEPTVMETNKEIDPEQTETASEGEAMEMSDSAPTPGQRVNEDRVENHEKEKDAIGKAIQEDTGGTQVDASISQRVSLDIPATGATGGLRRGPKAVQSSTDDDSDSSTVKFGLGSVVHSFFKRHRKKKEDEDDGNEQL